MYVYEESDLNSPIFFRKGAHRDKFKDLVNNNHGHADHQHCFPFQPVERRYGKQFLRHHIRIH